MPTAEENELNTAVARVLESTHPKKLIVAGPGAGKTYLFKKLLEQAPGSPQQRLVLTFINNLKADLDRNLGELASTYTLHGYCQLLLHRTKSLRGDLSENFVCYPGLISLIKSDWEFLKASHAPKFAELMRALGCSAEQEAFYFARSAYYDAVDFDDSVYRVVRALSDQPELIPAFELALVDEFQDFNRMEAEVINLLGQRSPLVVAGDDDQALYGQLRGASWDYIRAHHAGGEFEIFELPFCMRCPEVVVAAINDVIARARASRKLDGRIDKPFRYFPPVKAEDSRLNPHIDLVRTSVQSTLANYFGRYVEQVIRAIPEADFEKAAEKFEPCVLVIGSRPYLPQVRGHLVEAGLLPPEAADNRNEREEALVMLNADQSSNLGWRIILKHGVAAVARKCVVEAAERGVPLAEVIPEDLRTATLEAATALAARKAAEPDSEGDATNPVPRVLLTTYEGSKGMSAQYVVLVGLHDGELPRNANNVTDIEICKFLVGLTRTKKKCTIIASRRFGNIQRSISAFVNWIQPGRFNVIEVNADYWRARP